ncbi:hypothetical protein LTR48_000363 [Friedmanniomyces endolithicus]|uniref:Uncharacterized protein n=1 Tax=Rachicladosporium monterosium TaxID=1507873 RepID=A0ABR0LGW5_9PEZI|nr:hypothetical protein LTR48_000363 [Friedmanniomyces endolithicus]KAK5148560.1 hypothetical protein LTR32_000157 [Rachicladosporium monterosium]
MGRADNLFRCRPFLAYRSWQAFDIKRRRLRIPAIFYAVDPLGGEEKRPTLTVGNGYDGCQEEMVHVIGFAALERGWSVITYEGPGQPTVCRNQNLGFGTEWEKVVTPVVDDPSLDVPLDEIDSQMIEWWGGGGRCGKIQRDGVCPERSAKHLAAHLYSDAFNREQQSSNGQNVQITPAEKCSESVGAINHPRDPGEVGVSCGNAFALAASGG